MYEDAHRHQLSEIPYEINVGYPNIQTKFIADMNAMIYSSGGCNWGRVGGEPLSPEALLILEPN